MYARFGPAIFSRNLSVNMPHMLANEQMLFLLKHSNPVARLPLTQAVHLAASHLTLIPRGKAKKTLLSGLPTQMHSLHQNPTSIMHNAKMIG
jgi:hypothetical protein